MLELGPATKFAVRSALSGEREKGRVDFNGEAYIWSGAENAKPRRGRPPGSGKGKAK